MNTEFYILLKGDDGKAKSVLQSCGVSPEQALRAFDCLGLIHGYANLILVQEILVSVKTHAEILK